MAKQQSITVFNSAHSGYRRADISFVKGDNVVENATDAQILAITNDKRLVLQKTDSTESTGSIGLVANPDGLDSAGLINELYSEETTEQLLLPPENIAVAVAVMFALQSAGTLVLTGTGVPTTACLEDAIEEDIQVSAAMRDEAWAWLQANPDYQSDWQLTDVEPEVTEQATTEGNA